jgi:8-oxo-dGTP pyrophosphatase MutT (NUDIX family)
VDEGLHADSVAAIIFTPGGQYLLQQREDRKGVDFPGMWGLFGGSVEPGESREGAIARELLEELELTVSFPVLFADLVFDERSYGGWYCRRTYFEVRLEDAAVHRLALREGRGMSLFHLQTAAALGSKLIPFDACALLMHARRDESRATRPTLDSRGKEEIS